MDESGVVDEEFAAVSEPLPDRPLPRPLRHWASERPVNSLVSRFIGSVGFVVIYLASPGLREALTLWIALLVTVGAFAAVGPIMRRRRANACRRSPHEPWRHDRAWCERGESRSWFVRLSGAATGQGGCMHYAVFVLTVLGLVLAAPRLWWAAAGAFGAAATLLCLAAWRIHGVGDSHLTFTKFPFHPGEPVTLHFGMSEGGAQFRRVVFGIAHVQEFAGGTLNLQRGTRRCFTGFDHRPPGPLPGPDFDVELTFDVPESAPGTRISDRFPRYWVLEVRGATTSGPYFERFLIPIYDRPPAPDVAANPPAAMNSA